MRDKIAAVISFAVVLPLLPATATTGKVKSARQFLRQLLQRVQRVGHEHLRQRARRCTFDQRADGALCGRRLHKCRAVKVRTAQRHKQRARLQCAAIGADASVWTVLADQFAAGTTLAASLKRALHAAAPNTRSASLRSLKERRVSP